MNETAIAAAIHRYLNKDGKLSCAAAFRLARDTGSDPLSVGQIADAQGIKLYRCQLGLFGYGPKVEGRHKIVQPAAEVEPGMAQAIHDGLVEGQLPCQTAWEIAAALSVPKMRVSAATEALHIKIVRCQIGAF